MFICFITITIIIISSIIWFLTFSNLVYYLVQTRLAGAGGLAARQGLSPYCYGCFFTFVVMPLFKFVLFIVLLLSLLVSLLVLFGLSYLVIVCFNHLVQARLVGAGGLAAREGLSF